MLTRRHLLQASLGGAAVGSAAAGAEVRVGTGTDYDVIIIGAGVAGLAAAAKLLTLDTELKVIVLEARDRVGGRVFSVGHEELQRDAELGAQFLLHEDGADWEVLRRLRLDTEALPGDRVAVLPGMAKLVTALAGSASGLVQLNSESTEILYREGLVGVYYENRGLESAVTARRLVCTLPAGVLRDRPPKFSPPLPAEKLQALTSIPAEPAISIAMMFKEEDARLAGAEPVWIRDEGRARLRAFRTGYNGELLIEAQFSGSRAEALAGQSKSLLMMLALRGFTDALEALPDLEKALWTSRVDWLKEPFSRGARSAAVATSTHLTLAQNLGDTVFFAGEATADPTAVGTVHGALESGERAAREVALSLNIESGAPDANQPIMELL